MKKLMILFLLIISNVYSLLSQEFIEFPSTFAAVQNSTVNWGDLDNDGDFDLIITGEKASGFISLIYRNDDSVFVDINAGLPGIKSGSVFLGDLDHDGDLDILLSGSIELGRLTKIYLNDNMSFTELGANLVGISNGESKMGDLDNDGDLDIMISGYDGLDERTSIYINNDLVFTVHSTSIENITDTHFDLGDIDKDGDIDIAITGQKDNIVEAKYYLNENFSFTEINSSIANIVGGEVEFVDLYNENIIGVFIFGFSTFGVEFYQSNYLTSENNSLVQNNLAFGISPYFADSKVVDFNSDGTYDIALSGSLGNNLDEAIFNIYNNIDGLFAEWQNIIKPLAKGSMAWGDIDNDKDLDLIITGIDKDSLDTKLYKNNLAIEFLSIPNLKDLNYFIRKDTVYFNWELDLPQFEQKPNLTYELQMGTESDPDSIKSGHFMNDGTRLIPKKGAHFISKWKWFRGDYPDGNYTWAVQAINTSYQGSDVAYSNFQLKGYLDILSISEDTKLFLGDSLVVEWDKYGQIDSVDILISFNSGNDFEVLQSSIENNGRYSTHINHQFVDENNSHMIIRLQDSEDTDNYFDSEVFSISLGAIEIESINTSTLWTLSDSYEIQWNSQGNFDSVVLSYRLSELDNWTEIDTFINNGSYIFTPDESIVDVSSNSFAIRLVDKPSGLVEFVSQAFRIQRGSLILNSHQNNTNYTMGELSQIIWTPKGFIPKVKIEYSVDNGLTWIILSEETLNDGIFSWEIPAIKTNEAQIKIYDYLDPENVVSSQNSFKILNHSALYFTEPIKLQELGSIHSIISANTSTFSTISFRYGESFDNLNDLSLIPINNKNHNIILSGLNANTNYVVEVNAMDNKSTVTSFFKFHTYTINTNEMVQYNPLQVFPDLDLPIRKTIELPTNVSSIDDLKMFIRQIGDMVYLTLSNHINYSFTIPNTILQNNLTGYEYYYTFSIDDQMMNIGSSTNPHVGQLQIADLPVLDSLNQSTTKKTLYQMVSLPFNYPGIQSIGSFLSQNGFDISSYSKIEFRSYIYENGQFIEFTDSIKSRIFSRVPSLDYQDVPAILIASRTAKNIKTINGALTMNPNLSQFKWELKANEWTIVGSPYAYSTTKNHIFEYNDLDPADYFIFKLNDSGTWEETDIIEPFEGFAIINTSDIDQTVRIPKSTSNHSKQKEHTIREGVQFVLSSENETNKISKIFVDRAYRVPNFKSPGSKIDIKIEDDFDIFGTEFNSKVTLKIINPGREQLELQTVKKGLINYVIIDSSSGTYYRENQKVAIKNKQTNLVAAIGSLDYIESQISNLKSVPEIFSLSKPYPNPFNPTVSIDFEIPNSAKISATVYNVLGKVVNRLIEYKNLNAGYHSVQWNGLNNKDQKVATGLYFIRLNINQKVFTKKVILVK